ncbi:MAG: hypothetical protein OXU20_22130 [Myxococcales bacterium]|nr:hypothetical protein [Myxococcales bacterium]
MEGHGTEAAGGMATAPPPPVPGMDPASSRPSPTSAPTAATEGAAAATPGGAEADPSNTDPANASASDTGMPESMQDEDPLEDAAAQPEPADPATASDAPVEAPPEACDPAERGDPPETVDHDPPGDTTGPYAVVIEHDPGLTTHTVYRPAELGVDDLTHPVVVWANGGCVKNGLMFSKALTEWASHGFLIISDGRPGGSGSSGLGTNGEPQRQALDWIFAENDRPCSQYYRRVNVERAAAMGQSCGGLMTFGVSADPRLDMIAIWNSGMFERDQEIYAGLHTPIGFFIGGSSDVAYPQAEADFAAIDGDLPIFYGNLDVGHAATWGQPNGGEFGRVGVHWLRWHLFDDPGPEGEQMFVGSDCGLCGTDWEIRKKNMR